MRPFGFFFRTLALLGEPGPWCPGARPLTLVRVEGLRGFETFRLTACGTRIGLHPRRGTAPRPGIWFPAPTPEGGRRRGRVGGRHRAGGGGSVDPVGRGTRRVVRGPARSPPAGPGRPRPSPRRLPAPGVFDAPRSRTRTPPAPLRPPPPRTRRFGGGTRRCGCGGMRGRREADPPPSQPSRPPSRRPVVSFRVRRGSAPRAERGPRCSG